MNKRIDEDFLISYGRIGQVLIEILKEDDVSVSNVKRSMNIIHEFHILIKEVQKTNMENFFMKLVHDKMKNTVNTSTLPTKLKTHLLNILNTIKERHKND
jgi:hypothetical protein